MPDIPASALAAAALAIHRAACPLCDDPDHDCARDAAGEEMFIPRARAALEAAAPLLAEAWGVAGPGVRPASESLHRAVLRAACPKCGSGSGEKCRSLTNRPVEPHSARFLTATRTGVFRDIPEVPDVV